MQQVALAMHAGKPAAAVAALEQLSVLMPRDPGVWCNLGMVRTAAGDLEGAADALRRAIELNPEYTDALACLGMLLATRQRAGEAEGVLARAVALAPERSDVLYAYTRLLTESGRAVEAVGLLREALARRPRDLLLLDKLCMMLNYVAGVPAGELFEAHRRFGAAAPGARTPAPGLDTSPDRALHVGYVSPDLREHSVAYFLEPLLEHRDRVAIRVTLYNAGSASDAVTERLRGLADGWWDIAQRPDEDVFAQVRADRIDILIDLAGHTSGNRLGLFALRPAPVQGTYIGYPNTTGLTQIDFRVADETTDPMLDVGRHGDSARCRSWDVRGGDAAHALATERLVRLPGCFLCYRPSPEAPEPAAHPTPEIPAPPVVFGSFNSLAKLSPPTLALWSRLLHEVPGSRLTLKGKGLADPAVSAVFRERFGRHNIEPSRLIFASHTPGTREHLGAYSAVDVALDPFPYCGTTTTCEALWMGVPVVSLVGATHASRVGLSILTAAGLGRWAARTEEGYLEIAKGLAADAAGRRELRRTLRPTLGASPLCDAAAFTERYGAALRAAWRNFARGARP
jgi:predicted O-linked N-acetylglucosamine transferase (SPINDLY family)